MSAWRVSSTESVERLLLFMLCSVAGDVGRCEVPDAGMKLTNLTQWLVLEVRLLGEVERYTEARAQY